MRLVTYQSMDALKELINKGYLRCNKDYINLDKSRYIYSWIVDRMNEKIENKDKIEYPIWCWVKCYKGISPMKHRGDKVNGFDVKITFHKSKKDVFITDYRKYSFLLNNIYIPKDKKDKERFFKLLEDKKISLEELKAYVRRDKYCTYRTDKEFMEVVGIVRDSFSRVICNDGDILQGCVWQIKMSEVEKIEILPNDGYTYGTLNYVRSNGKRKNWIEEYYDMLD